MISIMNVDWHKFRFYQINHERFETVFSLQLSMSSSKCRFERTICMPNSRARVCVCVIPCHYASRKQRSHIPNRTRQKSVSYDVDVLRVPYDADKMWHTVIHFNQFHQRCLLAQLFVSSNTHTHERACARTVHIRKSRQASRQTGTHSNNPYTGSLFRGRSVALKFALSHYTLIMFIRIGCTHCAYSHTYGVIFSGRFCFTRLCAAILMAWDYIVHSCIYIEHTHVLWFYFDSVHTHSRHW